LLSQLLSVLAVAVTVAVKLLPHFCQCVELLPQLLPFFCSCCHDSSLTSTAITFTACLCHAQGALTSIYLASSPEVEGVSGKYFDKCRPIPSAPLSYDLDIAVKLWQVSEELTAAKPSSKAAAAAAAAVV
jgi:hypothetical protein